MHEAGRITNVVCRQNPNFPNSSHQMSEIHYTRSQSDKVKIFTSLQTAILNIYPATTGDCHVTFWARHPDDKHLCDDRARWRPEWHECQLDDNNVLVYGARILFSPKRKPNLMKFMLLSDSVHLTDPKYFSHVHFNFDTHDDIIQPNQNVALTRWEF